MSILGKIMKFIFLICLVVFVISFFQKDDLPEQEEILEELYQEPIQKKISMQPFEIEREGVVYKITPLYDYELKGLVVSNHDTSSWLDYYHKEWNDYINIKDVCVVWGSNIETNVYQSMKFKNGSWTCYYKFKNGVDSSIWSKYRNDSLSNNHLLSDDKEIDDKIMNAENGDQIYLKGYLVNYSLGEGGRGTSTTRDDTGNGACETIYITDFQIIKKGNILWHSLYFYSKSLLIALAVIFFLSLFAPIKPIR